jgi:hypothetical protein
MQELRPSHVPVPKKRLKQMQRLLGFDLLPLSEHAGKLLAILLLEAGPDGSHGNIADREAAEETPSFSSQLVEQALHELKTFHHITYEWQAGVLSYTILSPAAAQTV